MMTALKDPVAMMEGVIADLAVLIADIAIANVNETEIMIETAIETVTATATETHTEDEIAL